MGKKKTYEICFASQSHFDNFIPRAWITLSTEEYFTNALNDRMHIRFNFSRPDQAGWLVNASKKHVTSKYSKRQLHYFLILTWSKIIGFKLDLQFDESEAERYCCR